MSREPLFSPSFLRRLALVVLAGGLTLGVIAANTTVFAAQLSVLGTSTAKPVDTANAAGGGAPPLDEKVAPDSPRASVGAYMQLTRAGDFAKAASYLDLASVDQADGPQLAKRLREVLDRHLWIDVDRLSANAHGNPDDGLAADREDLGNVPGVAGKPVPVQIVRRVDRLGSRWVFAATTVARVDGWYEHLENRWLLEHLPKWALRFGPKELRWWQWFALVPLMLAGYAVAFVVTRLSRLLIKRVVSAPAAETARNMRAPASLAWMVITCYVLLPWLGLYEPANLFVRRILSATLLVSFFLALWKTVELSQHSVSCARWARNSHTAASLLMLGARMGKFVVAAFAFVAVLAELGYPVTSIITGLGIGGVALALAAQKTVENLFGAFSLAIDQPFREGDVIQVDGITGTVESMGLRSTRIRTVERTLISIPNGKLAEMRVETITARDRLRFYCVVGVAHAPAPRILEILHGIEALLRGSSLTIGASVSVCLVAITDSAMNLEVAAMIDTTEYAKFLEVRQGLLLDIVTVIDKAGSTLAHPVSSIKLSEAAAAMLQPTAGV